MDCSTESRPVVLPRLSAKLLLVIHRREAVETRYWQNCLVIWTCICCEYCPGDTLHQTNSSFKIMRGSRERHWLQESTHRCGQRNAPLSGGRTASRAACNTARCRVTGAVFNRRNSKYIHTHTYTRSNKTGKVPAYSLEHTNILKAFFMPHYGRRR